MALKIIKSNGKSAIDGYCPYWYGAYRDGAVVKTISLGVPMKGHPPASGHLADKGDHAFEQSRKDAQAELDRRTKDAKDRNEKVRAEASEKGDAIRETRRIIELKTGRRFEDPALTDLADLYISNLGDRSTCHLAMIRSGFSNFAAFAAAPVQDGDPAAPRIPKARTLVEVTPELATAFFKHIAHDFAFSTVKRWSNLLTGAFDRLAPVGMANPFKGARLAAVGRAQTVRDEETGEKRRVETVVHHRPIDRDQLRKLYQAAKDDPLLYPLTVTAASTGLRISDVCTLLWSDVHLAPKPGELPHIMVETTAKTGAKIAVPIFNYDPASPDYEPDLGELRRVLEAALAESTATEKYVFPRAARLYLSVKTSSTDKDGKPLPRPVVTYPGRDTIYAAGKRLFARALFADEPEDAEIITNEAKKPAPTTDEILATIDAAEWTDERKKRIRNVYTLHTNGASYLDIMKATGHAKSTISHDLGSVEALVGAKVKARQAKRPSARDLLQKTRQERAAGKRGASIYSWHSLRAAFVVLMKDNGVDIDTIRLLVGHTTCDMTLEYYNPTQKIAAETARRIILRRNHAQALTDGPGTRRALPPPQLSTTATDAPRPTLDALRAALAALTPEERAQLLTPTK